MCICIFTVIVKYVCVLQSLRDDSLLQGLEFNSRAIYEIVLKSPRAPVVRKEQNVPKRNCFILEKCSVNLCSMI